MTYPARSALPCAKPLIAARNFAEAPSVVSARRHRTEGRPPSLYRCLPGAKVTAAVCDSGQDASGADPRATGQAGCDRITAYQTSASAARRTSPGSGNDTRTGRGSRALPAAERHGETARQRRHRGHRSGTKTRALRFLGLLEVIGDHKSRDVSPKRSGGLCQTVIEVVPAYFPVP